MSLRADRVRLKQVVVNLLSNAVKYNRDGGSVLVDFDTSDPATLGIRVTDTGAVSLAKLLNLPAVASGGMVAAHVTDAVTQPPTESSTARGVSPSDDLAFAIALAAVFAVLGVLPLIALLQVGVIVCIGVLLDTLLVRTVIVPALAFIAGEKFWWPRKPQIHG